jgi:hypothetical protein
MTAPQVSQKTKDNAARAVLALIAVGLLVSFNIWYTAQAIHTADARWCELISGLDDRWRAIPNPAPEAAKLAVTLSKLRQDLECSTPGPVTTDPRPSPFRS